MPTPEERTAEVQALAKEVVEIFEAILKEDRLGDVPDDALGQLFASVLRLYAAKIEEGGRARAFASNSGITATDVMIGCTAILQATNIGLFDLGHWQSMTTIGKHLPDDDDFPEE